LGLRNETKLALFFVIASALLGFTQVPNAFADPANTQVEIIDMDGDKTTFKITDPDGVGYQLVIASGGGGGGCLLPPSTMITFEVPLGAIGDLTVTDCQQPSDTTRWIVSEDGVTQVDGIPFQPQLVGGVFITIDTTSLLLAYGLVNSWWMAPIGIGIGLGIYLVKRRF